MAGHAAIPHLLLGIGEMLALEDPTDYINAHEMKRDNLTPGITYTSDMRKHIAWYFKITRRMREWHLQAMRSTSAGSSSTSSQET